MRFRVICALGAVLLFIAASRAGSSHTIIVKVKEGKGIEKVNKDFDTETAQHIPGTRIYLVRTDDDSDKLVKKANKHDDVEAAEDNPKFKLNSAVPVQGVSPQLVDDMMSMLDGHTMTSFNGSTVLKAYAEQPAMHIIGVDQVRDLSTGAGTRVGYIDTGVDPNHPALKPWLDPGADVAFNRTSSEFDGLTDDMFSMLDDDMFSMLDDDMFSMLDHRFLFLLTRSAFSFLTSGNSNSSGFPGAFGHGTMVAGVIHVVAPDARLVPIKAFDANGDTDVFTLIEGVYKAIDLDVDVLNMSFSTDQDSDLFHDALNTAKAHGIALVAAAGNDARDGGSVYPAGYNGVYGVAATDLNDKLASFSNFGSEVSLTAPGAYVVSTVPGGKYAAAWGTSFSAPIVAGAMALRESIAAHGQSDGPQVVNASDPIDSLNPGFERKLGKGRLNVRAALKAGK